MPSEINAKKTKIITNDTDRNIAIDNQMLRVVED